MVATIYKLAETAADYDDAYELCQAEDFDLQGQELEFPTVLAYEDHECVGFMSCHIQDDMVVSGPLLLRSEVRRPITALRLCEAFERELGKTGVSRYIISVNKDSILAEAIPRYSPMMKPYANDGTNNFYIRQIGKFQNGREG